MINYHAAEFIPQGDTVGIANRTVSLPEEEHSHNFTDIILIKKGEGRQIIDGKIYDYAPGSLFFIDRLIPHAFEPSGRTEYIEIILIPDFFENDEERSATRRLFYTDDEYQPTVTMNADEVVDLTALIEILAHENARRAGDYRTVMRLCFKLIMLNVARALERMRSELANRDPEYILSVVLEYVDKHFTENISQEELAARFRYNSAYFSRMFKKHRGENLSDYITKKRIDYAAELLLTTELSAEQISERVGYKSKPQFYNTFTRYMDKTPRQYRIDNK